jgi:DNA repair exonuclease SbcCD ATPase subunit
MKLKKIFHIADIHIRNVKRHKEYRQVFLKMFEEIKKRGVEDSIIYLAGDIAHAKLEMSPELLKEISWLFTECSKLCTTILIAGNHDCNMNNADRLDVLTPIVEALKLPNFHYLRNTQTFRYADATFGVFSIFDNKDNWPTAEEIVLKYAHTPEGPGHKIALFHGPVDHSKTDIGYVVSSRHFTADMFDGYNLALLGDIHKRQEMISPKGCKIVYPGSLLQQNFGESMSKHGFLVWNMDDYSYEEVDIENDYGYYTLDVTNGIVPLIDDMPKRARLRIRLTNTDAIETKKVITKIKMMYGIDDFTIIRTDPISKLKTGNRTNALEFEDVTELSYQNSLIIDYIERMMPFVSKEDLDKIQILNTDLNARIVQEEVHRNIVWKPIKFEFSNMFSYGEDNIINFDKIGGLVGLFAPNASGKSSLFDSISFCLYDKCSRAFKAQNILNNRKKEFVCHLHFRINDIDYHIERTAKTVNKGKNVKVDVQFWREDAGEVTLLNGNERRDTNSVIEQYVGTYEDFVLTALSVQGNNALFIDKSQSERKDLLAQFMGLTIFDKLYEMASEDIKEVSTLIKNFKKTDFTSELADKVKSLGEKKSILKKTTTKISELNSEKESIIANLLDLNKQLIKIDDVGDLDELNSTHKKLQSQLNDIISAKDDNKKSQEQCTKTSKEYLKEISEIKSINGTLISDAKKEWDYLNDEFKNVNHEMELLQQSINQNEEKLLHLEKHEYDPNCKFCMNNIFVKDAIATKEVVINQKENLIELKQKYDEILERTKPLMNVDEIWNKFNDLKQKYDKTIVLKEKLESNLSTIEAKEQLIKNQIKSIEDGIKRYNENEITIVRNKHIKFGIDKESFTRSQIEQEISKLNKEVNNLNGQIGSLTSFIDSIKEKIDNVKELEEKDRLYTYYLDAIKRDGVPYELISKALPMVQNEVNNILAQVVDFGVVMDVDGKNINAKLVYEDQEWPLEMSSGMEKFVSGLAIRVALINICNLPRPNFLVIDEGFGSLDADNLSSLFMMMQYLKTQFEFIWMISHLEQMRDIVDGLIEIKKIDGFSKINY